MQHTLHEQHILVTGATGNLGPSLVEACLALGANVLAVGRRRTRLSELSATCSGHPRLRTAECDLTHPGSLAKLLGDKGEAGPVTAIVHAAGAFEFARIEHTDDEAAERMFRANSMSALVVLRESMRHLAATGGSVVLIGATRALEPAPGFGAYGASKAAQAYLVKTAALEAAPSIRINAVLPGVIDTPQNREQMPDADPSNWVAPEAIARAVVWLLSADSHGVSGTLVRLPDLV